MSPPAPPTGHRDRPLIGIAYILAGELLLVIMDALAKWVMQERAVAQVIFVRSVIVLALMAPVLWRAGPAALRTRRPVAHLVRVALATAAIFTFFVALRELPLATAIAISFGAPLFMTALSVPMLGERVGPHRWGAVLVGFVGVLVIAQPGAEAYSVAALLAVLSSVFFAASIVLMRGLVRTDSDLVVMFYFNTGVMATTGAITPFVWTPLDAPSLAGIALMAVLLLLGQIATIRAFRYAAVAIVAPFHYVSLPWAAAIGFLVWHELPAPHVWWGAAIVIASGLYVIWREARRARETPKRND